MKAEGPTLRIPTLLLANGPVWIPTKAPKGGKWTYEVTEALEGENGEPVRVGSPFRLGSPVAVYPDFRDPIEFRGRTYPRHLITIWTRHDGLQVTIVIRTDRGGPEATGVLIESDEGLHTTYDYRPSIPMMVKQAAAAYGFALGTKPQHKNLSQQEFRIAKLRVVADAYREAIELGAKVLPQVKEALKANYMEVGSESRVYALIHEARQEGLLPPTKPGKKGLGVEQISMD